MKSIANEITNSIRIKKKNKAENKISEINTKELLRIQHREM